MFLLEQRKNRVCFYWGLSLSCPYHPHTPSTFLLRYMLNPIVFSYDAVNIKGKLELVPKDDDYNIFLD